MGASERAVASSSKLSATSIAPDAMSASRRRRVCSTSSLSTVHHRRRGGRRERLVHLRFEPVGERGRVERLAVAHAGAVERAALALAPVDRDVGLRPPA